MQAITNSISKIFPPWDPADVSQVHSSNDNSSDEGDGQPETNEDDVPLYHQGFVIAQIGTPWGGLFLLQARILWIVVWWPHA